jgi:hypothetical protein
MLTFPSHVPIVKLSQQLRLQIQELEDLNNRSLKRLDDMIERTTSLLKDLDIVLEEENSKE